MTAVIVQASDSSSVGFKCYGAAREFWRYQGPECILAGPYETGKTLTALYKLHTLLAKYPGSQALMVRKTYKSLTSSAVVTFEKKVLPYPPTDPRCPVKRYGGERPEWYDYPNGSRLMLGGMDNADKFLSAEFDFIYVNQAEELSLSDWEKLTGRATGRAANAPYAQVMGDCNPGAPQHWIKQRPRLKLFASKHEDNPTLYDPETGQLTERGQRTMDALNALTGVRLKRGRFGLWVANEGQVYEEWNDDVHVIDRFDIPASWPRYRCIDFGYRNPFVCGWWATDEDRRLYLYREIYMTARTVKVHAEHIKRLGAALLPDDWLDWNELHRQEARRAGLPIGVPADIWQGWESPMRVEAVRWGESYVATIADHDASDRATLRENGIDTLPAKKDIKTGIEAVQEWLKVQGDGRPGLSYLRDSLVEVDPVLADKFYPTCTVEEFPGYVFPEGKENRSEDENPVKVADHGMDMTRYMVMHLHKQTPARVFTGAW